MSEPRRHGVIKSIKPNGTFGFIIGDDTKEYFFHKEDFMGHWVDLVSDFETDKKIHVTFQPDKTPKGFRAHEVNRMDWPNIAAEG